MYPRRVRTNMSNRATFYSAGKYADPRHRKGTAFWRIQNAKRRESPTVARCSQKNMQIIVIPEHKRCISVYGARRSKKKAATKRPAKKRSATKRSATKRPTTKRPAKKRPAKKRSTTKSRSNSSRTKGRRYNLRRRKK